MSLKRGRAAYVSMPFGVKRTPFGGTIDFDVVYNKLIRPAALTLGLSPQRADGLLSVGVIHKAIFEAIAGSEFMIADLTLGNPNVLYELGLRHALVPTKTAILIEASERAPYDLNSVLVIRYELDAQGLPTDSSVGRVTEGLDGALLKGQAVASPFFQLVPGYTPATLAADGPSAHQREQLEILRSRLLEARRALPEEAVSRLRELEPELIGGHIIDTATIEDLVLAYRDCQAWDDVIRLVSNLPSNLQDSRAMTQQLALALNRRNQPDDSDRAAGTLEALLERFGPDAETYSLLGRIHKDRFARSGQTEDLDAAIDAYRLGYETNPDDYHPGINLATLLLRRSGADDAELHPLVRELRAVLARRTESPFASYWDLATRLELAAIARDWRDVHRLIPQVRASAESEWMLVSTAGNLRLIAENLHDPSETLELERVTRDLLPASEAPGA